MKFLVTCVLLSICLFINVTNAEDDKKLIFVQILYRHGDRAPITLYPNDPNSEDVWTEGLGALTLLGRRQHYALGKYFRSRYQNFTTSSPLEVDVISSDCDRCRMSAESNMASFFAPTKEWTFEENVHWQPFSIKYIPKILDKYLETDSSCPRATQEGIRVLNSPAGQKFMSEHKIMMENLTYYSGKELTNWTITSYFHDTIYIEKRYNLTIPAWIAPFWDELVNVSNLAFFWSYNSPLLHRLRAGPLLQKIIEKANSKLNGEYPNLKFQIYSGHDTNIAVVLNALNLFNMVQPPYCSSLIFELYEHDNGQQSLRLLYQNSSNPETFIEEPHVLILEGCTEFCPLQFFINYTASLIPDNWDEECQLQKSIVEQIQDKKVTVGWFLIMIAIIVVCMSVYGLWRIYSQKREKENECILKDLHMGPR